MREGLPTLVTGASGHLGANLVRALLARGRQVRVLIHENTAAIAGLAVEIARADLLDREAVARACRGAGTVFHLAGKVSAGWEPDAEVNAINVMGTGNVIEGCLAAGVRRLVHFSSIQALVPGPGAKVLDETGDLVPSNDRAHGSYDRAKAAAEQLVLDAARRGLDAVVVHPTAVIGPFDFQRSPMGEVLAALGRGALPALVAGGSCDFVDARDVVEGALAAEARGRRGERYVLSGTRLSLVALAGRWAVATGRAAPRLVAPMILARLAAPFASAWARWRGRRPLFTSESLRVLRTQPPTSYRKAAGELGYQPRPLDETLRDTYAWMQAQGWL
jgi:dihydroflavonol-4-reductase